MSFFELFFKLGNPGRRAGLVHLRWTLVAETTKMEEPRIGAGALITHTIPLLYRPLQVGKRPELPIRHRCCRTKRLAWGIAVQPSLQVFQLARRKVGLIATDTLVYQAIDPTVPVVTTPVHQVRATAARDVYNLLDRVPGTVQSNGLVAGTCRSIFVVGVGPFEFVHLFVR
jgi:hypothetical protein